MPAFVSGSSVYTYGRWKRTLSGLQHPIQVTGCLVLTVTEWFCRARGRRGWGQGHEDSKGLSTPAHTGAPFSTPTLAETCWGSVLGFRCHDRSCATLQGCD